MNKKKVRDQLQSRLEQQRLNNITQDSLIFGTGVLHQNEKTLKRVPFEKFISLKKQ